jgi:hypothetical protein
MKRKKNKHENVKKGKMIEKMEMVMKKERGEKGDNYQKRGLRSDRE